MPAHAFAERHSRARDIGRRFWSAVGKRSATPLFFCEKVSEWQKRRRRFALPAQSKTRLLRRSLQLVSLPCPYLPCRGLTLQCINSGQQACIS